MDTHDKLVKEYNDIVAIHPGYYLKEHIQKTNISMRELTQQVHVEEKKLQDILKGMDKIDAIVSEGLTKVFNTPTNYWIGLQEDFDKTYRRIKELYDQDHAKKLKKK